METQSIGHEVSYTCPYCGKPFDIKVYDSVDAQADPDLKDRVISGDIFEHTCPHCHKTFMVQNPMFYMDRTNKFALWLSNQPLPDSIRTYSQPLVKEGYRLRRCATIHDFIEKIQIFTEGLDDAAIELAKYDCFIEFVDNRKGDPKDITSIDYLHNKDDVLKVNVRTGDKGMTFYVPYNIVVEELKAEKDLYTIDDGEFPCIDQKWIIALFQKNQEKM